MSIRDEVFNKREDILRIAADHGIRHVRIFGSVARNQDTLQSDIDFLVEMEDDRSLFDLVRFKHNMEEHLGRNVDVVTENSIHIELRQQILNEAIEI